MSKKTKSINEESKLEEEAGPFTYVKQKYKKPEEYYAKAVYSEPFSIGKASAGANAWVYEDGHNDF